MKDMFLKIDGIEGESTDDKYKGWIEILSFSLGATNPTTATRSSVGGAGSERVNLHDVHIVKQIDKASVKIFEQCCSGLPVKEVTISLNRAGGDKMKYMEIKMEEVVISSFNMGGSHGGDVPTESISFNYGKIKKTYFQQKRADGKAAGQVVAGWDAVANKKHA